MRPGAIATLSLVLVGCAPAPAPRPAPPPAPVAKAPPALIDFAAPWPSATPEEAKLDRRALERLVTASEKSETDALLVVAGEKVVVARTFGRPLGPIETKSVTKGFVGLAVGFLVAEGKLSIDDPLSRWFPEWKTPPKSQVLLRHVLTHTSGLSHEPLAGKLERQADRVAYARGLELVTEPGATFSYNNEASMLLSGIIASAAGEPIDAYLKRKLFEPLGIDDVSWQRDPAGNVTTNGGLTLGPVSLAKVGLALRDGRVVPAAWLAAMRTPTKSASFHGLLTWLIDDAWYVQTTERRTRLGMIFTAAPKLAPLDGKRFTTAAAYWMEAGRLLDEEERLEVGTKLRDDWLPIERTKPVPAGFHWNGWLGQYLVVLERGGVVAVRLRREPKEVDDDTNAKIGMFDFVPLLRSAQR